MKEVDYIIVGQGLSGTFFAFQLLMKGKTFVVIDKGYKKSSSYIAAGIINPVALKRLSKSWRAEDFINYNKSFYPKLEAFLNKPYHHYLAIHKLISSSDDEIFWQNRYNKSDLKGLVDEKLLSTDKSIGVFSKKFKIGKVKKSSWLNLPELLVDFREYLKEMSLIVEEEFSHSSLRSNQYKEIAFKKIVFCEGAKGANNPFFNYLPFALNKGQLLSIKSESIPRSSILKKKVFILPTKTKIFKVGATYSWSWSSVEVEKDKTSLLEEQLKEITTADYSITEELTGIRPASKDRRPLLGRHPKHRSFFIFNGMGSKGCLIAPLLSNELLTYIESGEELNVESSIKRFKQDLSG